MKQPVGPESRSVGRNSLSGFPILEIESGLRDLVLYLYL